MNALTIVNKINQELRKIEEHKPRESVGIIFRFFRQEPRSEESRSIIVIDSGFKVQVVEDDVLDLQNNRKSYLIDTKNVSALEFISSKYFKV